MLLLKTLVGAGLLCALLLFQQDKAQRDVSFNLSSDSRSVLFNSAGDGGSGIYALDLPTSRVRELRHSSTREDAPAFAPDGRRIIYTAASPESTVSHICTYSSVDKTHKQLTNAVGVYDDMASFSSDGTQIVFARALLHRPYSMGGWTWDHWDIYVMRSDGTGVRRLTSGEYYMVSPPRFAPDNQTVVFDANHGEANEPTVDIFKVGFTGKDPAKPLTRNGHSSEPVFTPDGRHIIYISDAAIAYDYEVWSMDRDGEHPIQLTNEHSFLHSPLVMQDGKHFLALADKTRAIRYDLYEFNMDGTHPRRVADNTLFDDPTLWKPK